MSGINLGILQEILLNELESPGKGSSTKQKQIGAFTTLLKNGDKQAIEIIEKINSENITPEDAFVLLSDYLATKH